MITFKHFLKEQKAIPTISGQAEEIYQKALQDFDSFKDELTKYPEYNTDQSHEATEHIMKILKNHYAIDWTTLEKPLYNKVKAGMT